MRLLAGKRQEASCKMIVHVYFTTWLRLNTQKVNIPFAILPLLMKYIPFKLKVGIYIISNDCVITLKNSYLSSARVVEIRLPKSYISRGLNKGPFLSLP